MGGGGGSGRRERGVGWLWIKKPEVDCVWKGILVTLSDMCTGISLYTWLRIE